MQLPIGAEREREFEHLALLGGGEVVVAQEVAGHAVTSRRCGMGGDDRGDRFGEPRDERVDLLRR